ncbi:MAG: DUF6468 domain-containing protein [Alphaproteobacteria bacterium]|jgi:hypothetical protein|nr:DUF6468 domain-containing protein [Alphaproteobacteria bacterium]MDP7426931.1 DUF6468 domain-containing protein [Alphaproteobacteria bacterium]
MTGLLLDAAVALLLLATIFYCVLLNRRLTALRASYDDLQRLFSGFSRSIERAEAGITGLKIAAQEVGGDLQERIDKARALADELAFLTDRGDRLADQVADAGRQRPERGEAETPFVPPPPPPGLESESERELREALREAR